MKQEINPFLVIVVIAVLLGAGIGMFTYLTAPRTPAGVKYTPGVPPWKEKSPTPDGKPAVYNPR